jgi:hypothetical protein
MGGKPSMAAALQLEIDAVLASAGRNHIDYGATFPTPVIGVCKHGCLPSCSSDLLRFADVHGSHLRLGPGYV